MLNIQFHVSMSIEDSNKSLLFMVCLLSLFGKWITGTFTGRYLTINPFFLKSSKNFKKLLKMHKSRVERGDKPELDVLPETKKNLSSKIFS